MIARVGFGHYYSLMYMAKNNLLQSCDYVVDFREWVKAGVAYNTRAGESESRKVSSFAKLYKYLEERQDSASTRTVASALRMFYNDLFDLYEKYAESTLLPELRRGRRKSPELPADMTITPAFEEYMWMEDKFPLIDISMVPVKRRPELVLSKDCEKYEKRMLALYNASKMKGVLIIDGSIGG